MKKRAALKSKHTASAWRRAMAAKAASREAELDAAFVRLRIVDRVKNAIKSDVDEDGVLCLGGLPEKEKPVLIDALFAKIGMSLRWLSIKGKTISVQLVLSDDGANMPPAMLRDFMAAMARAQVQYIDEILDNAAPWKWSSRRAGRTTATVTLAGEILPSVRAIYEKTDKKDGFIITREKSESSFAIKPVVYTFS